MTGTRAEPGGRVVLYIEDTSALVELLKAALSSRPDITLLSATRGDRGLQLARECHPDLILLDLFLPDIDGTDVLDELQADRRTEEIPVVIFTADATQTHRTRALQAGARDYLTKPIGIHRLLEVVDEYVPGLGPLH